MSQTNFASRIITTRTQDEYQTRLRDYPAELPAQDDFDFLTKKGNEHEGYLRWDLQVKHPELGWITRRTMFSAE